MAEKILIVGVDGFIGAALAESLTRLGHEVVGLSRRKASIPCPGHKYQVVEGSTFAEYERILDGCGVVFHVASASTPGSSAGHPLFELEKNLAPTLTLLEALQRHDHCRLIYFSSGGTLYGDVERSGPAKEGDLVRAKSYYAAGKASAEQFIRAWSSQYGSTACILRPSNVYGPGQSERQGFGIIPRAFGKALRNEVLTIWGDGSSVRDYLYIDDLVSLCVSLVTSQLLGGTTLINASSGRDVSVRELVAMIESVTGFVLDVAHEPAREVDVARISIDSTLARETCGWVPETSLDEGLRRSWSWFKSTQR